MKLLILILFTVFLPVVHAEQPIDTRNTYLWKEGDSADWYEWWYYKVVDPQSGEAFFFTYGIVNPGDKEKEKLGTKALVQAGAFGQKIFMEQDFSLSEFSASRESTNIRIGTNVATDKRITGSITDPTAGPISWDLAIDKNWTFNAMGWATDIPNLSDIYWYPAQASARATGTIEWRGKKYAFHNAPAYQDRNWGRSFPKWWTWLVSNHFKNSPGTALAAGGGRPKAFNSTPLFSGLCIGLSYLGKEYAFRTTDGDNVKMDIRWGTWEVNATNKSGQKIEISASAPKENFLLLPFTTPKGATFYDYETLTGAMTVKLYEKRHGVWSLLTTLETDQAGIEWGSPTPVDFENLFSAGTRSDLRSR